MIAVQQLQEVLHDNPRASDALMLEGRIALQRGAARDAIQAFRTVLKDQPEQSEAYALLRAGPFDLRGNQSGAGKS